MSQEQSIDQQAQGSNNGDDTLSHTIDSSTGSGGNAYDEINRVKRRLEERIIGQQRLVTRMFVALLTDGHLLVEGAPGLAKTRAIKELSNLIEADYQRVQFTPDLLPADITGTEIYRPADGSFKFQPGPIFNNLILADEINRAPAKVQSALLEAMAESQVSVGQQTYGLPPLFMVMATQNPIEQEGTYPLPEAQLDRFLMHVRVDYPDAEHEQAILALVRDEARIDAGLNADNQSNAPGSAQPLSQTVLFEARRQVLDVHISPSMESYLLRFVTASREPGALSPDLSRWIAFGASPRGTLALDACARAHAWLAGRDYVSPDDVQSVVHEVLRHRILLSFEAEADAITADTVIDQLLSHIAVP